MVLEIQGQQWEDVGPLEGWEKEKLNGPKGEEPWAGDNFHLLPVFQQLQIEIQTVCLHSWTKSFSPCIMGKILDKFALAPGMGTVMGEKASAHTLSSSGCV